MKSIRSRSSASGAQANFSSLASSASLFPAGNVKPGYRTVLGYFSAEGVFIEYMYSFANNNVANVVIRPSNLDKCIEVLKEKKVDLLAASDLYKL